MVQDSNVSVLTSIKIHSANLTHDAANTRIIAPPTPPERE
jgi:hypothetical protein